MVEAAAGVAADRRERSDPGGSRRGSHAVDRPRAKVLLKEIGFVVQHCCYVGGFKYQSFPEDPV